MAITPSPHGTSSHESASSAALSLKFVTFSLSAQRPPLICLDHRVPQFSPTFPTHPVHSRASPSFKTPRVPFCLQAKHLMGLRSGA